MEMNESVKAALIALDLREGATMNEVRAQYVEKTSANRFAWIFINDERLKKEFLKYHTAYLTLVRFYMENEGSAQFNILDYPRDQVLRIHINQGVYHMINQKYLNAGEKFQEAYAVDNKNVTVLLYLGYLLLKRKSYVAAEKYFKDITNIEKDFDDAWYYLGECYFKAGELKKALPMYNTAKLLNPQRSEIAFRIKEINEKLGLMPNGRGNSKTRKSSSLSNLLKRIFKS